MVSIYRQHNKSLTFTCSWFSQKFRHISSHLPIIHNDGYVCELSPNHRFPMPKFNKVMNILRKDGVVSNEKQVLLPRMVTEDEATLVHTSTYVHKFFTGKTTPEEQRVSGFEWTPGLVRRVRFETGGTMLACKTALEKGLACSTAGGTHHAFPDNGTGFCLINDLAVATQNLLTAGIVTKVLIVDLDVHQGDGTAFIFQNNKSVFTFSMHCHKNFPFRKQKSSLDVPLEGGIQDKAYMHALVKHLPSIISSFKPDLVLYDAGVDPHENDELGKLKLTDQGLYERDFYVLNSIVGKGVPVATVIGGGYSRDIDELSRRHTIIHRVATRVWNDKNL